MQRANLTLKAVSLAVLSAISLGVGAQTAAAPAVQAAPMANDIGLPPVAAASAPAAPRAPSAAAVNSVAIGKVEAGTLKELEALQRETAIADMRKKLADLKPAPAPVAAPSVSTLEAAVVDSAAGSQPTKKRNKKAEVAVAAPVVVAPPIEIKPVEFVEPPKAKLVNLLVIGGRARADVMDGGRMFTVKEGDKLGRWTVSSINASGVTVERRFTEKSLAPLTPTPAPDTRPAIAEAFSGAYNLVNSAYPRTVETEKVETRVLESASPADVAVGTASVGAPSVPAMNAAAALPPLPKVDKPDSTSMTAVPPLPPALGSSTSMPTGVIPMPTAMNAAAK